MDSRTKVLLSVILGVIGISLATLVFTPGGVAAFLTEFSKWAPATLVSVFALWSADKAKGEAKESRAEAQAAGAEARVGREAAERGETLAAQPDKDKRKARKIEETLTYGTGPKGAARKARAKAGQKRADHRAVKEAIKRGY